MQPDPTPERAAAGEAVRPRVSPFCAALMSKKLLVRGAPALVEEHVLDASNHCWCQATSQVLGPDRQPVHPARCRKGRACFRSPLESML